MTENIILKKVLTDSKYFSNVISNLEEDDFDSKSDKYILRNINNIYSKYNKAPSLDELILYVDSDNLKTTEKIVIRDRLNEIKNTEIDIKEEILIDYTEKWVKSARVENILLLGADMLDGKGKETLGSIQQKMEDINKLTFKKSAGLDYKKDAMKNFLEYTQVDEGGIKSSLEIINIATGGGTKQGLHLVMAQSNSAKCQIGNTVVNVYVDEKLKQKMKEFLDVKRNKEYEYTDSIVINTLSSIELTIQELFEFLDLDNTDYDIAQKTNAQIYVKSDKNELIPILSYVKKNNKPIYKCNIGNNEIIEVADTHIFRSNYKDVLAKNSEGIMLDTLGKQVKVNKVEFSGYDDVYDFEVPAPHWYTHNENFANGLISHNTTLLCNIAIDALKEGKNVVFITMEEGELDIRERIDANLLDMRTEELRKAGTTLATPFQHLMNNSMGDLKIKAYGPMAANCIDYKSQLDDWRVKDNFVPDLIVHDSITITAPNSKNTEGLYSVGKSVSEELKALGVHYDIPVWSAVQTGRQAYGASSLDMADASSSIAIMQVATTVIGLSLDEHRPDIRILNIVKSRKMNKAKQKSSVVNIDTDKQRVWDIADNGYDLSNNKSAQYFNNLNSVAEKVEQGEISVHDMNNITTSNNILDSLLSR